MAGLAQLCVQIAVMPWRVRAIHFGMSGIGARYERSLEQGRGRAPSGDGCVGLRNLAALAKQRLAAGAGERMGATVAEVEARRMAAAFAEVATGGACDPVLLGRGARGARGPSDSGHFYLPVNAKASPSTHSLWIQNVTAESGYRC